MMAEQETIMRILKAQQEKREVIMQIVQELRQHQQNAKPLRFRKTAKNNANAIPNQVRTTLKTANRISEPRDTYIKPDEKSPTSKEVRAKNLNTIKTARHMKKLRRAYITMNRNLQFLKAERDEILNEKMSLTRLAEEIDTAAKNVEILNGRLSQLQTEQQNLHFWNWKRKQELDKIIEIAEQDSRVALYYFRQNYQIAAAPKEVSEKITKIEKAIEDTEPKIVKKKLQISTLAGELAEIKKKYDTHKFKILKKSEQQPEKTDELSHITGCRPSVKAFMQELRQEAKKERQRKEDLKKLRTIKPKRMLMITSHEQKKRSLAAVIGKSYRKTTQDVRPISALPVKKKNIIE